VPPCSKHLVLCLPPLVAHVDGQRAFPPCSGHRTLCFPALVRHVKGQRADPPWVRQYAFFLDRDILSVHVDGQRLPTPCSLQKVARLAAVLLMIHQSGQSVSPRFLGCTSTSLLASFLLFADVVGTNAAVVSIEGCCGYQGNNINPQRLIITRPSFFHRWQSSFSKEHLSNLPPWPLSQRAAATAAVSARCLYCRCFSVR
jgi:hypothetical protein